MKMLVSLCRFWISLSIVGLALPAEVRAQEVVTALPLRIFVAVDDSGERVVEQAWITTQLAEVNRIYAPARLSFAIATEQELPSGHARLENRADRHALGSFMGPTMINVFFVERLRDVDEPSRFRQGVHWRPRGDDNAPGAHLVIVASNAGDSVLAHEIGHFFRNGHSDVPGNIMSYSRLESPPEFDDRQRRRIRYTLRRMLGSGELVPID